MTDIKRDITNIIPEIIRRARMALKQDKLVSRNKLRKWGYLPRPWDKKRH